MTAFQAKVYLSKQKVLSTKQEVHSWFNKSEKHSKLILRS